MSVEDIFGAVLLGLFLVGVLTVIVVAGVLTKAFGRGNTGNGEPPDLMMSDLSSRSWSSDDLPATALYDGQPDGDRDGDGLSDSFEDGGSSDDSSSDSSDSSSSDD